MPILSLTRLSSLIKQLGNKCKHARISCQEKAIFIKQFYQQSKFSHKFWTWKNDFLQFYVKLTIVRPPLLDFKEGSCGVVLTCEGNPVVGSSGLIQDQNQFRRSDSDLLAVDLWHIRCGKTREDRKVISISGHYSVTVGTCRWKRFQLFENIVTLC